MIFEKSHLVVLQVSTAQFLLDPWGKLSMRAVLVSAEGVQACTTVSNESAGEKLSI